MTEPTIPSWSSMKKYYKETRSTLFPLQDSIQKRDERVDYRRMDIAGTHNPSRTRINENEAYNNAWKDYSTGARMRDSSPYPRLRNPVPQEQPTRRSIPQDRSKYGVDQYNMRRDLFSLWGNLEDKESTITDLSEKYGLDPENLSNLLFDLEEHYANNAKVARQSKAKTDEALGLSSEASPEEETEQIKW